MTYQRTMQRIIQRYIFDIQREAEVTEGGYWNGVWREGERRVVGGSIRGEGPDDLPEDHGEGHPALHL